MRFGPVGLLSAALLLPHGGPVGAQSGPSWLFMERTAEGPSLFRIGRIGEPALILSCSGTSMRTTAGGLVPARNWPQPVLHVRLGAVERAKRPDASLDGEDGARLSIEFPIADSVLNALRAGAAPSVLFDAQELAFPAPPSATAARFAAACAALVPAGMRAG